MDCKISSKYSTRDRTRFTFSEFPGVNFYQNITHGSRVTASFIVFSEILTSEKPQPMRSDTWQHLGIEFVYINAWAKFYQHIPHGSRDKTSFTVSKFGPQQSLDLWQIAFGNQLGLIWSISMCIQNISKYSLWLKSYGQFSLSDW